MWWNFIGRSHEEIVEQREAWNGGGLPTTCRSGSARWPDFDGDRLLAPPLPNTRLKPRGRTHRLTRGQRGSKHDTQVTSVVCVAHARVVTHNGGTTTYVCIPGLLSDP